MVKYKLEFFDIFDKVFNGVNHEILSTNQRPNNIAFILLGSQYDPQEALSLISEFSSMPSDYSSVTSLSLFLLPVPLSLPLKLV